MGFLDAIYGFSLTLLIANLDVPDPEAWQSIEALLSHGICNRLSKIDSRVVMMNIVAAGLVIFIPFTTQGMSDPATAELPLPTSLYAVNIAAAMLAQSVMMFIARDYHPAAGRLSARGTKRAMSSSGLRSSGCIRRDRWATR